MAGAQSLPVIPELRDNVAFWLELDIFNFSAVPDDNGPVRF